MKYLVLLFLASCEPDRRTMEIMCIEGVRYYFYNRTSIAPAYKIDGKLIKCEGKK